MALCTSGNLSICSTAGTNRSISTEVGTGSGSLSALNSSSGQGPSMTSYYGYSNTPNIDLRFGTKTTCASTSTECTFWFPVIMTGRVSPTVITVCFDWSGLGGKIVSGYVDTSENSSAWTNRAFFNITDSGSFSIANIDYNDSLCVKLCLSSGGFVSDAYVRACLHNPPAAVTSGSATVSRSISYICTALVP